MTASINTTESPSHIKCHAIAPITSFTIMGWRLHVDKIALPAAKDEAAIIVKVLVTGSHIGCGREAQLIWAAPSSEAFKAQISHCNLFSAR